MDHAGFKRSVARWWRENWVLLVTKLTMPVALVVLIVVMLLWGAEGKIGPPPGPGPCPPQPTAALPFDPSDERQLAAYATDIFVGRGVGRAPAPAPASPVAGAPRWVPPIHVAVEVIETTKGTATEWWWCIKFSCKASRGVISSFMVIAR
jgi:hypothetical protein